LTRKRDPGPRLGRLSLLACGFVVAAFARGLHGQAIESEEPLDFPEPPVWPLSDGGEDGGEDGAEAAAATAEADASSAGDAPATRFETLLDLNQLAAEEKYDEALTLAEQLIELTEAEFGEQSLETAEAYETVATVQRKAGRHELSEENFLHAVAVIREVEGTFSELAIEPLLGLGDNYHDAGQHLNAVTAYNEARTINRRVFGLLNENQIPILDRITLSLQELEQYEEADEQQLTILNLAERNHPVGSPEYLEGIYRYANWLRRSGRYHEERALYARAQRIIRDQHGKDSPLLVRPLREIGNSFRNQRIPENQGISALKSALEILEAPGRQNPLATAEVLRDIGDWDVAFSKVGPSPDVYERAWALLGGVEDGDALRQQWFGELVNVLGEPISQRGLSRDPGAQRGYVVVQFDIDRFGRTQNVEVARSEPPGLKDDAVARAVRRWRFRPFISDGEVVAKDRLALQFNYRYLPDEGA
jgi:TonB family protein